MDLIDAGRDRCRGRNTFAAICLVAAGTISGCGQSPYHVAPVHGRVTIDGRPMSAGKIMFAPIAQGENKEPGKPAFGALQSDGSFALTTFDDNDGAIVGEHWATVYHPGKSATVTAPAFSRVTLPRKMMVVAEQVNEIEIALTSRDIARFGRRPD